MDIRIITEHDVEEFIRLRLEALTCEPYAFGRALEDERSRSPESVAPDSAPCRRATSWLEPSRAGTWLARPGSSGTKGAKSATKGLSGAYT